MDVADGHRRLLAAALMPTRPALVVHGHFHQYHQTRWVYPGGSAWVVGLECDGAAPDRNVWLVDVTDLGEIVRWERGEA